jgi:copper chaperone CopZ
MVQKAYLVEGMTCNHCKSRVEKSIKTIAGVEDAVADLSSGLVSVSGDEIDGVKIREVVEDAGYTFKGEA